MHNWLQEVWYDDIPSGIVLRPLSGLFGVLVALRRSLYKHGVLPSYGVGLPVVVIGNLTVGGSGKTPFTLWLAKELRQLGITPGIVLRGYGAREQQARLVTRASSYEEVGDEALLLARRSGCPVAVGTDRVAAARLLVEQGVDLILADDGLQHLRLKRHFEIVVIDGQRRFGNGRLLPAGPLRESVERLRSVNAVVVNGAAGRDNELSFALRADEASSLISSATRPLKDFVMTPVHAVAGIGNPERFFRMLESFGLDIMRHAFPDHHAFRREEVKFTDDLPVLMTEKDAMRCERFAGPEHWSVPVTAQMAPQDAQRLRDSVFALLTRRTRR